MNFRWNKNVIKIFPRKMSVAALCLRWCSITSISSCRGWPSKDVGRSPQKTSGSLQRLAKRSDRHRKTSYIFILCKSSHSFTQNRCCDQQGKRTGDKTFWGFLYRCIYNKIANKQLTTWSKGNHCRRCL